MILGSGIDLVGISRIDKIFQQYGDAYIKKILHPKEIETVAQIIPERKINYLAKRFCAKEAFVKAMGTGFNNKFFLSNICILNDKLGKPYYYMDDNMDYYIKQTFAIDDYRLHLSISDDVTHVVALAILERINV